MVVTGVSTLLRYRVVELRVPVCDSWWAYAVGKKHVWMPVDDGRGVDVRQRGRVALVINSTMNYVN